MSFINIKSLLSLSLLASICFSCSVYAEDTTINITSTPAISLTTSSNNITMNIEPTSTGSFQTTPLIITAGTNNPNGYTLYFSVADNNTNLAGNNSNISTLDNNGATGYTSSTFTMNRWGYSIGAIVSPDNDTTIYHPAPTITSPTTIDTYVGTINSRTTTINLATKVDFATAAGSYSKQLVISMLPTISTYELIYNQNTTDAVANLPDITITEQWSDVTPMLTINTSKIPTRNGYNFKGYTTTNGGTTAEYAYNATTGAFAPSTLTPSATPSTLYAVWEEAVCAGYKKMQDIATIKSSLAEEVQTQLCDTRDEKVYWVAKLKDGNIWMTQNLDLDLSTAKTLTPADTNITSNWTPDKNTVVGANLNSSNWATSSDYTHQFSWDGGNYYLPDGRDKNNTGCDNKDLSTCTNDVTSIASLTDASIKGNVNAHYHLGNLYTWTAALAMNDSDSVSATRYTNPVSTSICPKGWRLPTAYGGDSSTNGEFKNLNIAYGNNTSNDNTLRAEPLFFARSGRVSTGSLGYVGSDGYYWSSTVNSSSNAYYLIFYSTYVYPSNPLSRYLGYAVRCVAQ